VFAQIEQNVPQFHAMFHALCMQLNSYKESDVLMALTAFRKFLSSERLKLFSRVGMKINFYSVSCREYCAY
jgi:ribulose bisphosphate carboxylase small subunit